MIQHSPRLLIALSAGGKSTELAAQGLGVEHVDELMVRLVMKLLRKGHRLGFGGTLQDSKQRLTKYLIDTAQSWLDEEFSRDSPITRPETWPLVNYSAWPFHESITKEQRARMVGICRFVNVNPGSIPQAILDEVLPDWQKNPRALMFNADGLSAMRELSSREADLRIVWGGNVAGSRGWMAGVLEEVAYSLAQDKPILVLGGFGGCARVLADFLAKQNAPWPARLSLKFPRNSEP